MADDSKIELNRRRVLGGIVTIGGAAAAAGAGTFAFFSDSETSTGNTVQAGTLDLGSVSGSISLTALAPGDTISSTEFSSTYSGTIDAEIDIDVTISEPSGEPGEPSSNNTDQNATEFASNLVVKSAVADVGGTTEDLVTRTTDANSDSTITLDEFVSSAPYDAVTSATATNNDNVSLTLDLAFPTSVGSAAQADGVDITVDLIAQQPGED